MKNKEKIKEIKKELDNYLGTDWLTSLETGLKEIKQFKEKQEKVGTTLETIAENLPKNLVILNVKEELKSYFKDLQDEFTESIEEFKDTNKQKEVCENLQELKKVIKENKNKEELSDVITQLDEQIKGIEDMNKALLKLDKKEIDVNVKNFPKDESYKLIQKTIVEKSTDIEKAVDDLVKQIQPVKVENEAISEAIPVKLVDTENRFYTAKSGGSGGASGLPYATDTAGDNVGYALIDSSGHLQVDVLSGGGGGSQYADGTAVAGGQVGTVALGTDGANLQFIAVDSSGNQQVDIVASLPAGTNAIGKLAANDGVDIGDVTINNAGGVEVVQDTAADLNCTEASASAIKTAVEIIDDWDATHDSAASADGVQLMGAYDSTKPTAVADGDAVRILTDQYGRPLTGLEPEWFNSTFDSADATAEGETVKAATAAKKIYITSYIISSDIEGWIKLQDEDSNALTGKFWLKAGGGVSWTAEKSTPLVLNTANKALEVIAEAAGNVSVTVTGYLAP